MNENSGNLFEALRAWNIKAFGGLTDAVVQNRLALKDGFFNLSVAAFSNQEALRAGPGDRDLFQKCVADSFKICVAFVADGIPVSDPGPSPEAP